MSMLSEKRQEILAKIDALLADRNARIEEQVKIYKESLEAEPEPIEVIKLREVLKAIDVIIDSEEIEEPVSEKEEAQETIEKIVEEPVQEIITPIEEEVRIEEIPTQEELHLEEESPIEEIQPIEEIAEIKEEVISGIPAGEVIQPERPGIAEIQIPERR